MATEVLRKPIFESTIIKNPFFAINVMCSSNNFSGLTDWVTSDWKAKIAPLMLGTPEKVSNYDGGVYGLMRTLPVSKNTRLLQDVEGQITIMHSESSKSENQSKITHEGKITFISDTSYKNLEEVIVEDTYSCDGQIDKQHSLKRKLDMFAKVRYFVPII